MDDRKDIGLRIALKNRQEKHNAKLPSNFAYKTMRRIAEEQRQKERRSEIMMIISLAVVSVFGISVCVYLFGNTILDTMKRIGTPHYDMSASSIISISICIVFLLTLNMLLESKR